MEAIEDTPLNLASFVLFINQVYYVILFLVLSPSYGSL